MKAHRSNLTALAVFLVLITGRLNAQMMSTTAASTPRTLSWQGVITAVEGHRIMGEHSLTVTLYSDPTGHAKVWQGQTNALLDASGLFNCALGTAENPLPEAAALDKPLWIGTALDGGAEMRPLAQVSASAYALNVADNAITSSKIADKAVTKEKIGAEYVGSISVNGQKVSVNGSDVNFVAGEGLQLTVDPVTSTILFGGDVAGQTTGKGAHTQNANSAIVGSDWNEAGNAPPWNALNPPILGTTGAGGPLVMVTNGTPTLTLVPIAGATSNIIGGFAAGNTILNALGIPIQGSIIAGGGSAAAGLAPNVIVAPDDFSTISGGEGNTITNVTSDGLNANEGNTGQVIGGGLVNTIVTDVINTTENNTSGAGTISGGQANLLVGPFWGSIGGGQSNTISTSIPTVDDDHADNLQHNVIGGGNSNIIGGIPAGVNQFGSFSTIGGGQSNRIGGGSIVPLSGGVAGLHGTTRFGTVQNPADGSTIAGGSSNMISSNHGAIGGGQGNIVSGQNGVVAGGWGNTASGTTGPGVATVAGGYGNTASGGGSFVAGGNGNNATGNCTSIGGGYVNTANSTTYGFANIPGGLSLVANADVETVLGWSNFYRGTTNHYDIWANGVPGNPLRDARVLEVGSPFWNGSGWTSANAFEVSFNGHSIVYHTNGSSIGAGAPPVYQGATYVESPVYAWGEFDPSTNTVVSDFGVSGITNISPGVFMVSLRPADPHNPATVVNLSQASITVTVVNNDLADITNPPPPPPQMAEAITSAEVQSPVALSGDSIRRLLGVSDGTADPQPYTFTSSPSGTSQAALSPGCFPPAQTCGYATASDFTVLDAKFPGAGLEHSFIIRTYQGGNTGCQPICLPFFFKVCHR